MSRETYSYWGLLKAKFPPATICSNTFDVFGDAVRTSKSHVEEKGCWVGQKRWLTVESFTALNRGFEGGICSIRNNKLIFLVLITTSVSDSMLDHQIVPTISTLKIIDFSQPRYQWKYRLLCHSTIHLSPLVQQPWPTDSVKRAEDLT